MIYLLRSSGHADSITKGFSVRSISSMLHVKFVEVGICV